MSLWLKTTHLRGEKNSTVTWVQLLLFFLENLCHGSEISAWCIIFHYSIIILELKAKIACGVSWAPRQQLTVVKTAAGPGLKALPILAFMERFRVQHTHSEVKNRRAALVSLLLGQRGLWQTMEAEAGARSGPSLLLFSCCSSSQKLCLGLFFFWLSDSLVYDRGRVHARVTKSCVSHHGTPTQPAATVRFSLL